MTRPVNRKVRLITFDYLSGPDTETLLNVEIQEEYNNGWQLRYMKFLSDYSVSLLFTHAEFPEVADGNDD